MIRGQAAAELVVIPSMKPKGVEHTISSAAARERRR